MKCPVCGSEDLNVMNRWKFNVYNVARYRCSKCSATFNYYSGENRDFTIPKRFS